MIWFLEVVAGTEIKVERVETSVFDGRWGRGLWIPKEYILPVLKFFKL